MRVLKVKEKISALLDKLHELAVKAENEGKEAPVYDLCSITLDGASVFCSNNLGIPRKEMPQLKGKPITGSWADLNLDKDEEGEVNAELAFRKLLVSRGINVIRTKMPASMLKATQNQLTGTKVAGMLNTLKSDPMDEGINAPIFVSKDGYILDGHHRWAALVGLDAHPEHDSVNMEADIVDLGIDELLELAISFCNAIGIRNEEAAKLKILATKSK